MLLLARIDITPNVEDAVTEAMLAEKNGADWLHLVDADADASGAPQNVQVVHQILQHVTIPVQYRGGLVLVHTAELMIGLGVKRVVLDEGIRKTPHAAAHFFRRLGAVGLAVITTSNEAEALETAGCPRFLYEGEPGELLSVGSPVIAGDERNLPLGEGVTCEGVVVPTSRLIALQEKKVCSNPS